MAENNLGKLVRKAKGADRTLREYANDSGVDVAIISKMINGTYVPKKTNVLLLLTSPGAAPRGGVTYEQLVKAANASKSYQDGIQAGIKAGKIFTEAALATMGSFPLASLGLGAAAVTSEIVMNKKKSNSSKLEEVVNDIKRFVATSNGLIYSALGEIGISFFIEKREDPFFENQFDTYLTIDEHGIKNCIIRHLYIPPEQQKNEFFIKNSPKRMVEELVFLKPSKGRKVTIVTNLMESYEYMRSYRNKLSYNGDLSILLIDVKKAMILKEEYISHYCENDQSNEIYFVNSERGNYEQ